jgi:trehalose/maltose transport system substrate-binding protein
MYRQIFRAHSPDPDLCEIDIIWPGIIGDNLVDLAPYLGDNVKAFAPELLRNYKVHGRLVAVPTFVDIGVLYYRTDLLRKYGFHNAPESWDDLEHMATVIQTGERRAGNRDFWGYVWEGRAHEALTCNALEWQASEGAGNILEPDGTIHVCNPQVVRALRRAQSWVGTISPRGVLAYTEDDSLNVWQAGNAAFMRNWTDVYGDVEAPRSPTRDRFGVAAMPRGTAGHSGTLGDIAIGVSKYSPHRALAIEAIKQLTSEAIQRKRAVETGSIPTRTSLRERPEIMAETPLHGAAASKVMAGVVARPSLVAGESYDAVSRAYFNAVHAVLTRQLTAEVAMAQLETELVRITGFKAVR